jgi:hypothetical protein
MEQETSTRIIRIKVHNGEQFLETRECRIVLLGDGVPRAVWRGLAYPVLDGNRINVAGPAATPDFGSLPSPSGQKAGRFAILEGSEEAYLLIEGSILDCERASARLSHAGIRVIRSGRYLGDSVDGLIADWFVRFEIDPAADEPLVQKIEALLDGALTASRSEEADSDLRLRLIESELASARAREAALQAEIAQLRLMLAKPHTSESIDEIRFRAEIDALQSALVAEAETRAAAEALALENASRLRTVPSTRLKDEVATVFESLLPRIRLLRSSPDVIAAEFLNRKALYTALAELAARENGLPNNWKKNQRR